MKFILFLTLAILVSCNHSSDELVREHLEQSMQISKSNLEIDMIDFGKEISAGPKEKQNLALLGLKDSSGFPITVTFKVKDDCVAIAEAVKINDLFNEKRISCRSFKVGEKPDLKYIKGYKFVGFGRKVAVFEEGKLIKAGGTFSAKGELVHLINFKDEKKSGTIFQSLN